MSTTIERGNEIVQAFHQRRLDAISDWFVQGEGMPEKCEKLEALNLQWEPVWEAFDFASLDYNLAPPEHPQWTPEGQQHLEKLVEKLGDICKAFKLECDLIAGKP